MSAGPTINTPRLPGDDSIKGVLEQIDGARRWAADAALELEDLDVELSIDAGRLGGISTVRRMHLAGVALGEVPARTLHPLLADPMLLPSVHAFIRRIVAAVESAAGAPLRARIAHKEVMRLGLALARAAGPAAMRAADAKVLADQAREELLTLPHRLAHARLALARRMREHDSRPHGRVPTQELPQLS